MQIQDDYLDCYGDPETIGKIGTDIEDSKCSWLICTVLKLASEGDKEVIQVRIDLSIINLIPSRPLPRSLHQANYGRKDAECVARIKKIYKDLNVEGRFREYEDESYKSLCSAIDEQTLLPKEVFTSLLNKIYKRQK